jgi:branched-chain amino acid transport system ATP-binding protein
MDAEKGTIHALIGPNGAGKSTAFNCIRGSAIPPKARSSPEVPVLKRPSHDVIRIGIGGHSRTSALARMTVLENVLVGSAAGFRTTRPSAQARAGAGPRLRRRGTRKTSSTQDCGHIATIWPRVDFSCGCSTGAGARGRPGQLLDEPAAGLRNREILSSIAVLDLVRKRGVTIILVERDATRHVGRGPGHGSEFWSEDR